MAPGLAGVIEKDSREGAHIEAVQPEDTQRESQKHPVQRKSYGADPNGPPAHRQCQQKARQEQQQTRPVEKEIRTVNKHRLEIDPCRLPWRKPSGALVMAQSSFFVLQKSDRDFRGVKAHANRFQNHFRSVFP